MPKKPRRPGRPRTKPLPDHSQLARVELRLEVPLVEKLKAEAEKAGISLNQLTQALLEGCATHLHQGTAFRSDQGAVYVRERERCLYVGEQATSRYIGSRHPDDDDDPESWTTGSKGYLWFLLDFTGRAVLEVPQL